MSYLHDEALSINDDIEYASSDQMEIETIDEHNIHFITPKHYLIFLKYMKLNENFLMMPNSSEKLLKSMSHELNVFGFKKEPHEWASIMQEWKEKIRKTNDEIKKFGKLISMTAEDLELWTLLKFDVTVDANESQLSCMLDHLEIASDSPSLWTTISLEMDSFGSEENEHHWKNVFEQWCNDMKKKKKLLEVYDSKNSYSGGPPKIFKNLELRLLNFLAKDSTHFDINDDSEYVDEISNYCRTCLNASNDLIHIFEIFGDISLAEKAGLCAYITPIEKDDGFPQNICQSCIDLLENAFKFKTICEKSDSELRALPKENEIKDNSTVFSDEKKVYVVTVDGETVELLEEVQEETTLLDEELTERLHYTDDVREHEELQDEDQNDPDFLDTYIREEDVDVDDEEESESEEMDSLLQKSSKLPTIINSEANTTQTMDIHQCTVCGNIFHNESLLKTHSRSHSTPKPHQCHFCAKQFKTRISLKIHIRSHTNERPYVCETCGKSFKTVSAVNNHRAIHSGVKMFKCALCPYSACTKANLRIHDRTHSGIQPYACRYCDLKFSTASNMQKHIRNIHEKMKTHKCTECTRSFFTRESVRKHMVTHTGLKPYTCPACPTAYGWYNGLQKHMKMQHNGLKIPTEKSFYPNDSVTTEKAAENRKNEGEIEIIQEQADDSQAMTIVFIKHENEIQ